MYRLIIIAFLVAIVASLFLALRALAGQASGVAQGRRVLRALSWRIGLSLALFGLLLLGFYFGLLPQRG